MAKTKEKSLYERLGGYDAVAALVDDLLERLFADKKVNGFWRGHSEDSRRKERQLIVEFLCEAAGGPAHYLGRDMRTAHTGLKISGKDWDVVAGHLVASLDKFKVKGKTREDVLSFVTSLRPDIVGI